jgi:hypothetical protein
MCCKSFDFQFIVLYVTNTAHIWLSWLLKQSRNVWNTLWSEETETIQSYVNNTAWHSLQKCTINPHCASFWVHFDKIGQLRKHKRWNMRFGIFTESVHAKQYRVIQSSYKFSLAYIFSLQIYIKVWCGYCLYRLEIAVLLPKCNDQSVQNVHLFHSYTEAHN